MENGKSKLNRRERFLLRSWLTPAWGSGTSPERGATPREWRKEITKLSNLSGEKLTAEDMYLIYEDPFKDFLTELVAQNQQSAQLNFRNSLQNITENTTITITLDINNDSDLAEIKREVLELLNNNNVILTAGYVNYPLNANSIDIFNKLRDGVEVNTTDSEARAIASYIEFNNLQLVIYPNTGEFLIDDSDDDEAPQGNHFQDNLIEDYPHSLEDLDIYKLSQEEDTSINCLVKALIVSNLFTQPQIESIKVFIKNRATPTKELRKIAERLKVNFTFRVITKRNCDLGCQIKKRNPIIIAEDYPTLELCLMNKHYFIFKTLDWKNSITPYALENIDTVDKTKSYWWLRDERGKIERGKVITNTAKLVQLLLIHRKKLLLPKLITEENLDNQYWSELKEYGSLEYDEDLNTKCNTELRIKKFGLCYKDEGFTEYQVNDKEQPKTIIFDTETATGEKEIPTNKLGIKAHDRRPTKDFLNPILPPSKLTHQPYLARFYDRDEKKILHGIECFHPEKCPKIRKAPQPYGNNCIPSCFGTDKDGKLHGLSNQLKKILPWLPIEGFDPRRIDVRLIAHNAKYDLQFYQHLFKEFEMIENNGSLITAKGVFYWDAPARQGKTKCKANIEIRCSYKLLPKACGEMSNMFPDIKQEKEIISYSWYSLYNLYEKENEGIERIDRLFLTEELDTKEKQDQFFNNCKKWDCIIIKNKSYPWCCPKEKVWVNMVKYSGIYCELDCKVIGEALDLFDEKVKVISADNVLKYPPIKASDNISLPSVIFNITLQNGCFDDTYQISGVPQQFIQDCVVGGRTMLKNNEQQDFKKGDTQTDGVDDAIQDYDSVSCYSSGFFQSKGFLKGKPKCIKGSSVEKHFLANDNDLMKGNTDAYYIRIKITEVCKKREFPVISKTIDGIRSWNNNLVGQIISIDNITLEDAIEFQDVKFEFIDGYYFNDGFNTEIKRLVERLFRKRLCAKNEIKITNKKTGEVKVIDDWIDPFTTNLPNTIEGLLKSKIKKLQINYPPHLYKIEKFKNSIQEIYKLLLNSQYGKLLMKEIETEEEYISNKPVKKLRGKRWLKKNGYSVDAKVEYDYNEWDYTLRRHYNKIKQFYLSPTEKYVRVVYWKSINDHFNNVHQGIQVLSYAKRLMNRVICLAEDLGLNILYTDTDSIHIINNHIPILEKAYSEKYPDRQLRGEDLGQFNEDFDSKLKGVCSIRFIGLAKKCYIDVLKGFDKQGVEQTEYHIRMKGSPNASILRECNRRSCSPEELYELLIDNNYLTFDLMKKADGKSKCRFIFDKTFNVSSEKWFFRKLGFGSSEQKKLQDDITSGNKTYWKGKYNYDPKFSFKNYNKVVQECLTETIQVN